MGTFEFLLVASGLDTERADFEDRLFEAGCDDATIAVQKGAVVFEFSRDHETFAGAVESAIVDVVSAGGLVERLEPDYLVSLSDIAKRAGLTRAAIHNYAKGERGENFPPPSARVTSDTALWDWVDVARWLFDRHQVTGGVVANAIVVRDVNLRLFNRKIGAAA